MICLPAFLAGLIQGVTGFGAGIVMMVVFPYLFNVVTGAALSGAICIVLCLTMVYRYRKFIRFKAIVWPALLFSFTSSVAIMFSTNIDQGLLKLILGVFLVVLSVYFLFFAKNTNVQVTPLLSFFFVVISGIFAGLFGIGGPLMVIYFLSISKSKEDYLGTIQSFFLIVGSYQTAFRIYNGILGIEHIQYILIGMLGVLGGVTIANRIVHRINSDMLRRLTYIFIGISGALNVVSVLL